MATDFNINNLKRQFFSAAFPIRLIVINTGVFVLIYLFGAIAGLATPSGTQFINEVLSWFSIPPDVNFLWSQPWALVTYMFTHEQFFHLLLNMVVIYFTGKLFLNYLGNRQLIGLYIFGGLLGGIAFLLASNYVTFSNPEITIKPLLGASASAIAILVGITTYVPNLKIRLPFNGSIKLIYFTLIFIALTDILGFNPSRIGEHISHIGGAIAGWSIIKLYQSGNDLSIAFNFLMNASSSKQAPGTRKRKSKRGKMKVAYKRPVSDETYNAKKKAKQEIIDSILDKISKSGYESLTAEEKQILFEASNNN